jgi:hypothetical protein
MQLCKYKQLLQKALDQVSIRTNGTNFMEKIITMFDSLVREEEIVKI